MDKDMLQQMIHWIEGHLNETFSIQKLGTHMGYSPYYCSFKFHQLTGMTIKKYKLLRTMFKASLDLIQEPETSILTIAMNYGYSSQEAFSRSFKEVYGISPLNYRKNKQPIQNFHQLYMKKGESDYMINNTKKEELLAIQKTNPNGKILNILNGEQMYHNFKTNQLMLDSDYVPFNEAMCVNKTSYPIFDNDFFNLRALGHQVTTNAYMNKVYEPLKRLKEQEYQTIILWFGDDMFCQMNLLTILAFLEQINFSGELFYHSIHEKSYDLTELKLDLGPYTELYQDILINKNYQDNAPFPVLHQGINRYLGLESKENPINKFIHKNLDLDDKLLVSELLQLFSHYGLGDTQYLKMIELCRKK